MKPNVFFCVLAAIVVGIAGCLPTKVAEKEYIMSEDVYYIDYDINGEIVKDTRDLAYESYCDSIWKADPEYYMDVLMESDEYCSYVEENGKWF